MRHATPLPPKPPRLRPIVGVDGEGHDTPDGGHVYTYLACVAEDGTIVSEASNPAGLTHDECMECLLRVPRKAIAVGYSIGYDVAKWLEAMPAVERYVVARPEMRIGPGGRSYRRYWNGRRYDFLQGASFAVSTVEADTRARRSRVVYDVFRFFGGPFVEALKQWKIGTVAQRTEIAAMKARRGQFADEDPADVRRYCIAECALLAKLMRRVVDQHEAMGLHLSRYTGAGATANAMLKRHGVAQYLGPRFDELPDGLRDAVLRAFFGGRPEHSIVGPVLSRLYSYDISSAYPAAAAALPCLACGRWRFVADLREAAEAAMAGTIAVCRFTVRRHGSAPAAWGPLPFRDEKGSISFPWNFKGWAWMHEIVAGLRLYPRMIRIHSAWVYETPCDHRPFGWVPDVYAERLRLGADGAGLVLKVGLAAACYGKLAQSRGTAQYASPIWAGLVGSITRARLLGAIAAARDPWDVLSVATDGIVSRRPIKAINAGRGIGKPLGGWTHTTIEGGAMFIRPGLVYPIGAEVADVRARGVGRTQLHEGIEKIDEAWRSAPAEQLVDGITLTGDRRFHGIKTSILGFAGCRTCGTSWPGPVESGCPKCRMCGDRFDLVELREGGKADGRLVYGRWLRRDNLVSFDSFPKRQVTFPETPRGVAVRLHIRDMGGAESRPFAPGRTTPEGAQARAAKDADMEQPEYADGE